MRFSEIKQWQIIVTASIGPFPGYTKWKKTSVNHAEWAGFDSLPPGVSKEEMLSSRGKVLELGFEEEVSLAGMARYNFR